MKGFVHEVLCRSHTSGSVLQTALCYLEAICVKVRELVTQEKEQLGCTCEKESVERIIQGEVSAHGADPVCVRLSTVYGTVCSPNTR